MITPMLRFRQAIWNSFFFFFFFALLSSDNEDNIHLRFFLSIFDLIGIDISCVTLFPVTISHHRRKQNIIDVRILVSFA